MLPSRIWTFILAVGYTEDIFDALDIQDELQTLYTSGTVFHAFLGEKLPSWKSAAALVRKIAENYKLPYYTLSPTYSICKDHGYIAGEHYTCPECGGKTEVYSRITGYYRPVQNWNDGKAQEFRDRKVYDLNHSHFYAHTHDQGDAPQNRTEEKEAAAGEDSGAPAAPVKLLFTTKTCPNCAIAKQALEEAHIEYRVVDAQEHKDLAKKYHIMSAPTLVVIGEDGVEKLTNASNIRKYAEG